MNYPIPSRVPIPTPRPDQQAWAGLNHFPPPPQMGGQRRGPMAFAAQNPEVLLALGAGLLGGKTGSEQWSGGLGNMAQTMQTSKEKRAAEQQKNQTVEWLRQINPKLAQAVEMGALSPGDAFKMHREAQKPKDPKLSFQKLPDGTYGFANETDQSFTPLGQAQKPDSGLSVTLPDGTTVQSGRFHNQDQKNVANRVTAAQDIAASGASLKQTAQMLRHANENVGYSGVGGKAVGALFDGAEQFGVDAPGTPGGRALIKSGGLDVALQQVQKTKGAISNAEMALFMAASPGLQNTPEGNAMLIDMIDAVADRQIQRADAMEQWRQQHGTLDGFEAAWGAHIEQNPIIIQRPDGSIGFAGGSQSVNGDPDVDALVEQYAD
ncbi:hypothetical protein [Pseudohoeflea coraliihabitans]|uniref:Uncharacterized protein n=1 Tax=Pseudohoeflea coraliihabitans TaxID=2860393 RepID=A0ABS6WTG1_9HYPH|nr:hypothetical protein [Pseudohoeflea sp. DP4N28-3]MBW3099235.1 hypothetical protein [Pseudohoeflea sp. DP4N28-3]